MLGTYGDKGSCRLAESSKGASGRVRHRCSVIMFTTPYIGLLSSIQLPLLLCRHFQRIMGSCAADLDPYECLSRPPLEIQAIIGLPNSFD